MAERVRHFTLMLYSEAAAYAAERGLLIADTKFEFGLDEAGTLHLIDEVLTPDSSRFWPADAHRVGHTPPSFDKQPVRDYLETLGWDKRPPGPHLPDAMVAQPAERYRVARRRLMQVS
jgi:phosphoribosylaminoimidazole-succinocarboxamide synthase